MPLAIFGILLKNRKRLDNPKIIDKWGFLYLTFGRRAFLWEVEELLRKCVVLAESRAVVL